MELIFLGSGDAFVHSVNNYQSNMVIEAMSGKRLLIDCGSDARNSTKEQNLSSKDIDAVYISHFHTDHVGGLEWLAFTTKFDSKLTKPKLIIHPSMLDPLWESVLSGGLKSIKGQDCTITTYFDIHPIDKKKASFEWEGLSFKMIKTEHFYHNHQVISSYGLYITHLSTKLFITTDTIFKPEKYMKYFNEADLIFHDCETSLAHSGVHTRFEDLCSLPISIKNKMWLYHYSDHALPDAIANGFKGFVKKGQIFHF